MRLPNFLIIGAHKGGTTSLYHYLKQHPQVFMSSQKEPRFFALEGDPLDYRGPNDPASRCDRATLAAYAELFEGVSSEAAIGEASTLYLYHERAPGRILHYVPDAKLIAVLRDPVDRAYSNFVYGRRDGFEPLEDFRDALASEDERVVQRWGPLWHYKRKGFYARQLRRYYGLFDASQIRVFLYDDLRLDPMQVTKEMFAFLGVRDDFRPDVSTRHNVSGIPRRAGLHRFLTGRNALRSAVGALLPREVRARISNSIQRRNLVEAAPLAPDLREELRELFREDVLELQEMIGRDLSAWLA